MMDKASAPKRAVIQSHDSEPVPGWAEAQESLAAASGLAILLVAGHQPPALVVSNNNSICHAFQSSPEHAALCDPYCGEAFNRAQEAGRATHYRCHAGLHCFAMPIALSEDRPLAVIGGRAFLRSADYRALAERFRTGDLRELLSADLFRNVIFALDQDLDELATHIEATVADTVRDLSAGTKEPQGAASVSSPTAQGAERVDALPQQKGHFPPGVWLKDACNTAVGSLVEAQGISSVALMFRTDRGLTTLCATGKFKSKPPRITVEAKDARLIQAARRGESQITTTGRAAAAGGFGETVEIFPLLVGDEIKGVLVVGDSDLSDTKRRALTDFCREFALPLEVLRLREELERRMLAVFQLQSFNERINTVEPEEAYATVLRHSAELLRAERGSLLLFDERTNELAVKAAVGPRADVTREARVRLGEGVSGTVLREGRPLVMRDIGASSGHHPAPTERSYKTGSFISYPIMIGGRKVGVLNVTDKAGGGTYDEIDLGLLEMIAPQMALALDRAEWHQKATQFQLLSITDPLTGLLNRRYLEERLAEELERSKRHHFPMSFMMIDIDDFKQYNDRHGHQAGDLALEMTAQCLKSALRSTDVASRYGGEEFSILLPQTSLSEANVIAERIRRRVERTHYPHGKTQPLGAVTVSIGISAFGPNLDAPAGVIYAADQALYMSKSRGKNCVDSFVPLGLQPSTSDAERNAK